MKACKYCRSYFLFNSALEAHEKLCLRKPLFDLHDINFKTPNINYEDTPINPDHYKKGGIETFDYMRAKMSAEQLEGYLMGNILKYVSRYQYKNGVEDLEKTKWYLEKLIQLTKGETK